jgi:predicted RNase H-like HicB family nuclease
MGDDEQRHSMVIERSDDDEALIGTVPELPGCRTHGLTYEKAARQGRDAIESWIGARQASGRPTPAPRVYEHGTRQVEHTM